MGKGGDNISAEQADWLLIDGEKYNVGHFRHPGGMKLMRAWLGRDATAPFVAFHPNSAIPRKHLKHLRASQPETPPTAAPVPSPDSDLKGLERHAREKGWFVPSKFFYAWNLASILALEACAWAVLRAWGAGWPPYLAAVLLLTTSQAQAGWLQHDFGHSSVLGSRRANKLAHHFIIGHLKGASSSWWNKRHFRHHAQPNIVREDPDIDAPHFFLLGRVTPARWVAAGRGMHTWYPHQHRYWWLLGPPLVLPIVFHIDVLSHLWRTRNGVDFAWLVSYFARGYLLFGPLVGGAGRAFGLYMAVRFVESHWFTWVTQMSHIPMDIDYDPGPARAKGWVRLQLEATLNVEPGFFNDWFTGHLNYQIEHHLFPTMPRHHYGRVRPFVQALCARHGIPYREATLLGAMGAIVESMRESGELWLEAHHLRLLEHGAGGAAAGGAGRGAGEGREKVA